MGWKGCRRAKLRCASLGAVVFGQGDWLLYSVSIIPVTPLSEDSREKSFWLLAKWKCQLACHLLCDMCSQKWWHQDRRDDINSSVAVFYQNSSSLFLKSTFPERERERENPQAKVCTWIRVARHVRRKGPLCRMNWSLRPCVQFSLRQAVLRQCGEEMYSQPRCSNVITFSMPFHFFQ